MAQIKKDISKNAVRTIAANRWQPYVIKTRRK